jgi:uncharacterized RDD family membrane protein YckC
VVPRLLVLVLVCPQLLVLWALSLPVMVVLRPLVLLLPRLLVMLLLVVMLPLTVLDFLRPPPAPSHDAQQKLNFRRVRDRVVDLEMFKCPRDFSFFFF